MPLPGNPFRLGLFAFVILFAGCKAHPKADAISTTPEELQSGVQDLLRDVSGTSTGYLDYDTAHPPKQSTLVAALYKERNYQPAWTSREQWLPISDSLYAFIEASQLYGLFPEDYHQQALKTIRDLFVADSLGKNDRKKAGLWAKADVLMTDAFFQLVHDIKLGRLPQDSITLRKDSVLNDAFYREQWAALSQKTVRSVLESLEPQLRGYRELKAGIRHFLDSADYREYTRLPYPVKDSAAFRRLLQKRLYEGGYLLSDSVQPDSAQLAAAVKKFQQARHIQVDGRAGEGTIRMLNVNDRERFIRIAISMDKYKMLPEKMPARYIWVNISANYLQVVDKDETKITSKVISGKPRTRTPQLTSNITELITYPQWVPPPSIVSKEILPAVKKNPGYLAKRGFTLVDSKGEEVDPYSVDWSKYSKGIPYRVVQGSGDANALGIMKFVFSNKYSVYLHDTNQRYLFANDMRSLSHGCVRVQQWQELANYILSYDSLNARSGNYTSIDSMQNWLRNKVKKSIAVRNKLPVFIRYFTCEGKDGSIRFFDDVYGEDRYLREKYFAAK